jgi:rod shape determining protein RodA
MKRLFTKLGRSDWLLVAAALILIAFSLVVIFSLDNSTAKQTFFLKQIVAGLIGIVGYIFLSQKNYRVWQHYGWLAYTISFLLLLAVLIFGQEIRNIKAWFIIGPFSVQPVELIKIFFIVFLARFFSQFSKYQYLFRYIIISGGLSFVLASLVIIQPDWGSALILFAIWFVTIFFIPLRRWHYLLIVIILLVGAVASWQWGLQPYQKLRIMTFLNSDSDPLDEGYNITQAKVAIGSGGMWGRGLGFGSQSQLDFLPEAQTDFIFAVIAENFGFMGILVFLGVYMFFFYRLLIILRLARTDFGKFLILGVIIYIFSQLAINIGMNIGLVPVAGVPLPFVSAGGSSLVSVLLAVGIAQSVYIYDRSGA